MGFDCWPAAGAEINLLLRLFDGELWAIEIKKGTAPKITRGFHQACEDVQATQKYVVYGGDDEFPVKHDTTVISLQKLMTQVNAAFLAQA